jgi:hypothetical protein
MLSLAQIFHNDTAWKSVPHGAEALNPVSMTAFFTEGCCNYYVVDVLVKKRPRRYQMGEIVHTSKIKIVREKGPTRRAMIEGFSEPVYYGVHGGIMKFYKVEPEKEHAATLDHIVAATAG